MARAITLLVIFAVVTVVLHYIGPATRLFVEAMPDVFRFFAAIGAAVEIPF